MSRLLSKLKKISASNTCPFNKLNVILLRGVKIAFIQTALLCEEHPGVPGVGRRLADQTLLVVEQRQSPGYHEPPGQRRDLWGNLIQAGLPLNRPTLSKLN